ncbi:hypothetical protein [Streptomyces sp. WAC07149]|uniref:hypothetical protein n=1 Tax=Streptomyces sp. WAC07149 TaxID=2487425 RepID=UPI00163D142D|nr:hypothetical protein [Streptomyces sp. WAC07149]
MVEQRQQGGRVSAFYQTQRDEIVAASLHLPDGDAFLIDAHDHTPFPSLAAYTGSPCRIRAHARGRGRGQAHSIGIGIGIATLSN